ncbi:hypothetical protein ACEWY4_011585 [Coilia grayii]|uniref:Transmembrane protein 230 n=1 Tax=Coilia grayii TaxID=363190 RepID=A0ABD1JY22_9TELE
MVVHCRLTRQAKCVLSSAGICLYSVSWLFSFRLSHYRSVPSSSSSSSGRWAVKEREMPARNTVTNGIPNSKVRYSKLANDDDGYIDLQFKKTPPKVPYKAIALATVLFLIGSLLIIIGGLLQAGYFHVQHQDRTIPVLIIGILVFLPGFYHLRIAYYASRGYRGYSYDDIPDFD